MDRCNLSESEPFVNFKVLSGIYFTLNPTASRGWGSTGALKGDGVAGGLAFPVDNVSRFFLWTLFNLSFDPTVAVALEWLLSTLRRIAGLPGRQPGPLRHRLRLG